MAEYPALAIQSPNIVGNFLHGIQTGQDVQNSRARNAMLEMQQQQQQQAIQRDQQFRSVLAQSVGPMAADAAQAPGGGGEASNYLMQGTENPLSGPSPEQFNQLLELDPERAFMVQQQVEQARQQREAELQRRAGTAVRGAQFVLKSEDPKRTLELGFPEMLEQLTQQGIDIDELDDDAVRAMANDVIAQFGPIAGVGPAEGEEDFTLSPGQKRFRGKQVIAEVAPEEKDDGDPNDKLFTRTQSLRKEYESKVAGFEDIRSAYENVQNAQANDTGDTQLVLNAMRVMSPGIRIQPGERIEDAASIPGVPSQLVGIWNKLANKGKLGPEQRTEIRQQAKRTYATQRRLASGARARYSNLAKMSGLDEFPVVGDDWAPVAEYNADGLRAFDSVDDAAAAGLKAGTRVVIGGRLATITED